MIVKLRGARKHASGYSGPRVRGKAEVKIYNQMKYEGRHVRMARLVWLCSLVALMLSVAASGLRAQESDHKSKVPGLDKINSGSTHQAFTGNIKSYDRKRELLNVNTVEGTDTEIFPMKKKVHVATASGQKLKLTALKPGTNVIVYYDQKGDHRSISQIVVLENSLTTKKAKGPSS